MIYNVVDIESTCWENKRPGQRSEMIQIGICQYDGHRDTISQPISIYILPQYSDELSEFCVGLTGLTTELLEEKGVFRDEAIARLREEFKSETRPWVSWGAYDRRKFTEEAAWDNKKSPMCEQHLNLKVMYSVLSGGKPLGMDKALANLDLGIVGRHHDGADDAYNTARILQRLVKGWK